MRFRSLASAAALGLLALAAVSCGGATPAPTPTPIPTPTPTPPPNAPPVVDGIIIQGSRGNEPANFADAGESIAVSAKVHDEETPGDQLQYAWSATTGTFTGSGAAVTWIAPATVDAPAVATLTLKVTEKYGTGLAFEHSVEATTTLSLHDSMGEVGTMSRQFLVDFSNTDITDANFVMRNFGGVGTCPDPSRVSDERDDVINNYTNFRMINFRVDQPTVTVKFGGTCPSVNGPRNGDACVLVGVMWDSVDKRTNTRTPNFGVDQIAAAYAAKDSRWFLCASDYDGHPVSNPAVAFRYPR